MTLATHIMIPDTQCKPDVPTDHLRWIGNYIVDEFAGKEDVRVIHIGDHADMPSLSSYDRGKRGFEGRRYNKDIEAANAGFDILNQPLVRFNTHKAKLKERQWWPDRDIFLGNHEHRITRATESAPELDGTISTDDLNYKASGWTVHDFLEVGDIDGVWYSHFFAAPMTGKPLGAMVATRLKTVGHTFSMGHQQTLDYAIRYVGPKSQHGLVAGACYLHTEDYLGPQGNSHWRGIVVKHEVEDGSYCPMFVSLDYLCRRYEGVRLNEFMADTYGYTL